MRKLLLLGAIFLGLAGAAQAQSGAALAGHALLRGSKLTLPSTSCPAGVPVQTITVVNQAHVRPYVLSKVENAVVAQSMQLRAAWGTPCVQFGPGGWPLYLKIGSGVRLGEHFFDGQPYALVWTAGLPYLDWSTPFSHEVAEMLEDPENTDYFINGEGRQLELADAVEFRSYRLDGVWVTDFVFPSWFAGAMLEDSATASDVTCTATGGCVFTAPLIAPAGAPGPYDEMGLLTAPWQDSSGD